MTQSREMAEKKRVLWDGEEVFGLVSVAEVTREKSTIDVPGFNRSRTIPSGITTVPTIEMVYRIDRGTNTLQFFEDFYTNNEEKEATIIRTDGHGVEFGRRIMQFCECITITEPAYDAASIDYAKLTVTIVPWDYVAISNS